MAIDSEILTLEVDINDDPMNQKVDAIETRLTTLQKNARQTAEGMMPSTESLPGYNDALMRKLAEWERSLTDIGRTRGSMDHALSSYQREDLGTSYKRKVEIANRTIKDLTNSQNLVQELLNVLGPGMGKVFSDGLTGIISQLSSGIKTTAASISKEVSRKLTDDEIVDRYMKSDSYGRLVHKLSQQNPTVFNDQNMRKYLMANVPMNVPQYMRQAITGGSQVQFRKQAELYRDMLPKSFQKIEPHAGKDTSIRRVGENANSGVRLTQKEISDLGRIVRNNRYAADAAVRAGIISKSGKKMYFNPNTDHDMMDAMAGFLIDDMTIAAQGERKYGIRNVTDKKSWKNIRNKIGSNKILDGTLEASRAMDDAFGPWLNPGRFGSEFARFDPNSGKGEYVGRITHSPRKISRAFAEYTLDMMQNGAQISGMHPIFKDAKTGRWIEDTRATGPRKATRTKSAITPDDFHTISMNDSMLQHIVMSTPSASKVGQNGFSDNMFYLKFAEELGDPGLTDERRAEIAKQYEKLFAKGYKVNGQDYISTRVSKTHAEFMKASIVDDIGRKALGMPYAHAGEAPLSPEQAAKVRRAGLEVLSNGGGLGHFDTFKPFAKTMYNQNNMATEGESLATWLGTQFGFKGNAETAKRLAQSGLTEEQRQHIMETYGTPNMKVVVGRFGKSDMDGSNWISDRISEQGFQGRTFGGKATYVPINMRDFRFKNYKQIEGNDTTAAYIAELNKEKEARLAQINKGEADEEWRRKKIAKVEAEYQKREASIMNKFGGDLIIPGAGIAGGDLRVSKDTDVIEDVNNIKHFKTVLADDVKEGKITQEQLNEMRSRDYSRDEIYAKTTYDDAATSSRWLSKQVINSSMNAGFRDPRVQRYFDKQFFNEIGRMDDDQYVRDLLFKGDQTVDLQSEEAQKKINDHVAGMWARYSEGDRLLPAGVFKYAMAAPNPQSVINNRLKEAGIALTPEQKALELGDNQVISMESLNKQLGIVRFPATKTGNVTVDNAISAAQLIANGGATEKQIRNLARSSGIVDTKGLYFAPNSPILKLLQGEDFDGDLNGHFGLSDNIDPKEAETFSEVMRIIANASDKEVEELWHAKPGTPEFKAAWEEQEKRKEARTKESKAQPGGYDMLSPRDKALYVVNAPREHAMMGSAERSADMAALYYSGLNNTSMRDKIVQAIKDYESQYDVVSTNMKTDESWRRTEEQAYAADLGLSFSRMFKYANDAVETAGENADSTRIWNGKSKEYLQDKGIDALGLPSLFQGSVMGTLMGRMEARQQGIDPENGVYQWTQILDDLQMPDNVDPNSEQGKFVQMMRGVRKDFLDSKYLIASNETVDALQAQYEKAEEEIRNSIDPNAEGARKMKKDRLAAIGGQAFKNFMEFGATERNFANAPWTRETLEDFSKRTGIPIDQLVGHADFVTTQPVQQPAVTPQQTPAQKPASTQGATSNAVVTTAPTLPKEAQNISPETLKAAAKMTTQETADQQARRLLSEAGIRTQEINKVLNANERATLIDAITNNKMDLLRSIPGVGESTASKAMKALQGASILGIKTTSAEEMAAPVATVQVPNTEPTTQKNDMVTCGICLTSYSASLGSCPNKANHAKYQQQWKQQAQAKNQQASAQQPVSPPQPPNPPSQPPAPPSGPPSNPPSSYSNTVPSWGNNPPPGGPPGPPNNPPPGGPPNNPSGGNSWDAQAAQAYYGQLMGRAQEFSGKLFGEIINYEQRNRDIPQSIINANRNDAIAARYEQQIRDFQASADYQYLTYDQQRNMQNLISPKHGLVAKAGRDFSEMSAFSSSQLLESIGDAEQKASGAYDAQLEALNKWDEKIKEVEEDQKRLLTMSKDPKYSKDLQDEFKDSADKIGKDLIKINESRKNIAGSIQTKNQEVFDKQLEGLESKLHPGNRYQQQSKAYQQQIASIRESINEKHNAGLITQDAYDQDMARLKSLEKQTSSTALSMQQGFNAVGQSLSRSIINIASRFGRQLFQKALTEAKKFVVQYNRTMTEIQMITLKTDDQMTSLGDGLVQKAKEMKVSIADLSKSAATLYRQGLSDEEVDERLGVISKFSTVSGTKIDAATKLITVAMNTGLVTDPRFAADIVTALGDNAATNASEIEKGIEKAGAAAAADGTTFGQLTAMLTAILSTTQIGGSVAGRTLNTIFGRMNKIGTNELIYDENGNAVSGSAVAKLLERQGISMYDENGNKRSSYDTLYALSQKWETMSDAEQQQIATAIAGTRQYSNFAAIMQGMSEGKVDQYMALIGDSSGIVDKKYDVYVQSLDASLANLKNTFDSLISSLTEKGVLTGVLDTISGMIEGVNNLTKSMGGLGASIVTILPLMVGLTMMKAGISTGALPVVLAGAALAAGGAIVASANKTQNTETAQERYNKSVSFSNNNINGYAADIARAKELRDKGSSRTEAEAAEYKTLLTTLANFANLSFDDLSSSTANASRSVKELSSSAESLGEAAAGAIPHIEDYEDYIIEQSENNYDEELIKNFKNNAGGLAQVVAAEMSQAHSDWYNSPKVYRIEPLFSFNEETGEVTVREGAHENITSGEIYQWASTGDRAIRKEALGRVFAEALSNPAYNSGVPQEYVQDAEWWRNYFLTGVSNPQDLPDSVLQAVAKY